MDVDEVACRRVFWNTVGNFAEAFAKELARFGLDATKQEADYALGVALDTVALAGSSEMPWIPTLDPEMFVQACQALQCCVEASDQPLVEYSTEWNKFSLACSVCGEKFMGTKDQVRRKDKGKKVVCSNKCRAKTGYEGGKDNESPGAVQVPTAGRAENPSV